MTDTLKRKAEACLVGETDDHGKTSIPEKVVKSHKQPISDEQDMKSVEESVCNDIDGADDYTPSSSESSETDQSSENLDVVDAETSSEKSLLKEEISDSRNNGNIDDKITNESVDSTEIKSTGFVFGSSAKNVVSFASFSQASKPLFGQDEDKKLNLAETAEADQEVKSQVVVETGEENELTLTSLKAKLFQLISDSNEWNELGTGTIKINKSSSQEELYSRVIMRSDGIHKVLLNFRIFPLLKFELVQQKSLRLSLLEKDQVQHYLLRFRSQEDARHFCIDLECEINSDEDIQ